MVNLTVINYSVTTKLIFVTIIIIQFCFYIILWCRFCHEKGTLLCHKPPCLRKLFKFKFKLFILLKAYRLYSNYVTQWPTDWVPLPTHTPEFLMKTTKSSLSTQQDVCWDEKKLERKSRLRPRSCDWWCSAVLAGLSKAFTLCSPKLSYSSGTEITVKSWWGSASSVSGNTARNAVVKTYGGRAQVFSLSLVYQGSYFAPVRWLADAPEIIYLAIVLDFCSWREFNHFVPKLLQKSWNWQ